MANNSKDLAYMRADLLAGRLDREGAEDFLQLYSKVHGMNFDPNSLANAKVASVLKLLGRDFSINRVPTGVAPSLPVVSTPPAPPGSPGSTGLSALNPTGLRTGMTSPSGKPVTMMPPWAGFPTAVAPSGTSPLPMPTSVTPTPLTIPPPPLTIPPAPPSGSKKAWGNPLNWLAGKLDWMRKGKEGFDEMLDDPDAFIKSGQQMGGFKGHFRQGFGGMVKGMQNQSELGGMGNAFGAAGGALSGIPVVGTLLGSFGKLADVVLGNVARLEKFSRSLHASNMEFAKFSGAMSQVQVEQEIRDIKLSQERGERRAGSARFLAENMSELEQTTAPIKDLFGVWKDNITGGLSFLVNKGLQATGISDLAKRLLGEEGKKLTKGLGEMATDEGVKAWASQHGKDFARTRNNLRGF